VYKTSAASHLYSEFQRTSDPTSTRYVPQGAFWFRGPDPHYRVVHSDQGSWGLPATVTRGADHKLSTPWPVVHRADTVPITVLSQLLLLLAEAI
jgi:hypothetical protein